MYGNDYYPIKLGLNENVPFISYKSDKPTYHDINVVAINGSSERMQCIVVEKNGNYADFYYNGYEENFKILSEPGYEEDSWENEDCGRTPKVLKKNGVSPELIEELIEGYYN